MLCQNKKKREDFANSLPNFANKRDKRQIDSLMQALNKLAEDESADVKKALLNQFVGLVSIVQENLGEVGYQTVCTTIFPLIDQLLYDQTRLMTL